MILRTWVQIPRTHRNPDVVTSVYNPSSPRPNRKAEQKNPQELMGQLTRQQTRWKAGLTSKLVLWPSWTLWHSHEHAPLHRHTKDFFIIQMGKKYTQRGKVTCLESDSETEWEPQRSFLYSLLLLFYKLDTLVCLGGNERNPRKTHRGVWRILRGSQGLPPQWDEAAENQRGRQFQHREWAVLSAAHKTLDDNF